MFKTEEWQGIPSVTEPELSDEVAAYPLDKLPSVTPYSQQALESIGSENVSFLTIYGER